MWLGSTRYCCKPKTSICLQKLAYMITKSYLFKSYLQKTSQPEGKWINHVCKKHIELNRKKINIHRGQVKSFKLTMTLRSHDSQESWLSGVITLRKPWLARNMLPNIKTCENGFSSSWRTILVTPQLMMTSSTKWQMKFYFNNLNMSSWWILVYQTSIGHYRDQIPHKGKTDTISCR